MRSLYLEADIKSANGKTVALNESDLKELLQKIRANDFHFELITKDFDRKIKLHQAKAFVENGTISIELIWDGLSEVKWKEIDEGHHLDSWAAWNGLLEWEEANDRHFAKGKYQLRLMIRSIAKHKTVKKPDPVIVDKTFRGIFKALVIPLKDRSESEDDMALHEFDRYFLRLTDAEKADLIKNIQKKKFRLDEVVNIYGKPTYRLQSAMTKETKTGLTVELTWGAAKGVTKRDLESELSHSLGDVWGLQDHPFARNKYSFNLDLVKVEEVKA